MASATTTAGATTPRKRPPAAWGNAMRERTPPAPAVLTLPRNFLRPCVLLLLRESPAHGYDLLERLKAFGFPGSDPGGLYRMLRGLEDEGLVRSAWAPPAAGPAR